MATWDKERNLESARSLRGLEPQLLVPGHGPELRDPHEAMARAIERAHRALA
jgi:glyoxylase-like metal-dependent hydrolase (beta-lactamase superfamily II)